MKKVYIGKTKNGFNVFMDENTSHAVTHFSDSPKLYAAIKKVISELEVVSDVSRTDHDMGEEVGRTDLVTTVPGDEIVYALRPRRTQYARFVKNKKSLPTSFVTLDLRRRGDEYLLYTAFVGKLTPSFPGGDYLPEQSRDFWADHALVWGSQEVVAGTEISECPW